MSTKITVSVKVNAGKEKVWEYWNGARHITRWYFASEDWHTPRATNDLKENGSFNYRMESRDGSNGFDFEGTYDVVEPYKQIAFTMPDGRKVKVHFEGEDQSTLVTEIFEVEEDTDMEMQRMGWQAILDNFKKYVENH